MVTQHITEHNISRLILFNKGRRAFCLLSSKGIILGTIELVNVMTITNTTIVMTIHVVSLLKKRRCLLYLLQDCIQETLTTMGASLPGGSLPSLLLP